VLVSRLEVLQRLMRRSDIIHITADCSNQVLCINEEPRTTECWIC
jgi:hypothetical protein